MSQFVATRSAHWHVQIAGSGPVVLLLHGTGAATHTWRDILEPLSGQCQIVAPDLPGQGFTEVFDQRTLALPEMTAAIVELLTALQVTPAIIVGHSAGAAIGARWILDRRASLPACTDNKPGGLLAINPAMLPIDGPVGRLFVPIARTLCAGGVVPNLFARYARSESAMRRIIASTGSQLDQRGAQLYQHLVTDSTHVANTLAMMSRWDLRALSDQLHRLDVPVHIVLGEGDLTVPPSLGIETAERINNNRVWLTKIPGAGHLVHEENPALTVRLVIDMVRDQIGRNNRAQRVNQKRDNRQATTDSTQQSFGFAQRSPG
jgi:magnesium chelatase accessory protein